MAETADKNNRHDNFRRLQNGGRRVPEWHQRGQIPNHVWDKMSREERNQIRRNRYATKEMDARHSGRKMEHIVANSFHIPSFPVFQKLASEATQEFLESQKLSDASFYGEYQSEVWRIIPATIRCEILRQRAIKRELDRRAATVAKE